MDFKKVSICFTINRKSLNGIGEHLYIAHPHLYQEEDDQVYIPKKYENEFLKEIKLNKFDEETEEKIIDFATEGKMDVQIFSTSKKSTKVLWDVVADENKEDFTVVSFLNAVTVCNNKHNKAVFNVEEVETRHLKRNKKWPTANEHSKYGISQSYKTVCFGDLNHTKLLKTRGGGIYCFGDENLGRAIRRALKYKT
uniref:Uncharacterized protein n=1 Tax=Panagrolaimus sp. ES5 TaxID=591445 RepID=A0AC34FLW6_9BILA